MTVLIVGASGKTGSQLVNQLINRNVNVRIIVRNLEKIDESIKYRNNLSVIKASILEISDKELGEYVNGCDTVVSCLGHNLNLKGIFGKPHFLVTDATRSLCNAIRNNNPSKPVKFILMNTTGNSNKDILEKRSIAEKSVMFLLRNLLPPQKDNEKAAEYLRTQIDKDNGIIEWAAVRPDTLINESKVSEYEIYSSPIRSPIFHAGVTSRINVGHFMAELITNNEIWNKWKGKMPVIYNKV